MVDLLYLDSESVKTSMKQSQLENYESKKNPIFIFKWNSTVINELFPDNHLNRRLLAMLLGKGIRCM